MGAPAALISLRSVAKDYESGAGVVRALRDVDIEIQQGEFVAIVGTSGSGKSTLMNILGCLDRPTHGTYELAGFDVGARSSDARAILRNRLIGFIFQGFNLLSRTTALENVELPLVYRGVSVKERRRMALEALAAVGLADRVHHTPNQLSGGQQQRVAIARALVTGPPMLLADEPTGNLDTRTSHDVIALLQKLNQERGITVVLVTHEHDIAACASRVVQFRDGRIVSDVVHTPVSAAAELEKLPPPDVKSEDDQAGDDPALAAKRRIGGPVPFAVYAMMAMGALTGLFLGILYERFILDRAMFLFPVVFAALAEAAFAERYARRRLGRALTGDQRARLAIHATVALGVVLAAAFALGIPAWSKALLDRLAELSPQGVAAALLAVVLAFAAVSLLRFLLLAMAAPLVAPARRAGRGTVP
jgi:putative ABC transport system ATP-binding protein